MLHAYMSRLPWIFPGVPLKFNDAPGNIQGNLTHLSLVVSIYKGPVMRKGGPGQDVIMDNPPWGFTNS